MVHTFTSLGVRVAVDVNSGAVHVLDKPAYDLLADEQQEKLPVVKLDMDESDSLWDELRVELIPTIRLYENGESVRQIVAPKTKEALDEFLSA